MVIMTDLQKIFLMYSCLYLAVQFALFASFWVILIVLEKQARVKHAKCKALVAAKRASEQERWKAAYALYHTRYVNKNACHLVKAS
jgi:hypothetical protein